MHPQNNHILVFTPHFPPPFDGGAYQYNYHLYNDLSKSGFMITILTHYGSSRQNNSSLNVYPIKSIKTGRHEYPNLIFKGIDVFQNIIILRKFLKGNNFDYIFHDGGYLQSLTVYIANIWKNIPTIGVNFGEEINKIQKTTRIRAWIQRYLLQRNTFNICISKYTSGLVRDCNAKQPSLLIYPSIEKKEPRNKIEDREFLVKTYRLDPDTLIVGFLGRHIKRKGILNLIQAVENLISGNKKIGLLIAGHGAETAQIKQRISKPDLIGKIILTSIGSGEAKDSFFNGIDIFAMPNYELVDGDNEGFGIVFIEAAQYGTPVIGGDSGGVAEAISDKVNGLLVDGSDVESIANAIQFYYDDSQQLIQHRQNGKEWATNFINSNSLASLVTTLRNNPANFQNK